MNRESVRKMADRVMRLCGGVVSEPPYAAVAELTGFGDRGADRPADVRRAFYSAEDNEPPHVHVRYGGRGAKFWLRPVRLAQVDKGWKAQDLRRAKQIAVQHEAELLQAWQRYEERKKR